MLVTTPCPQCGGDIEFLEDAQAIKCNYCGSLLQLVGTEGVRYYYLVPRSTKDELSRWLIKGLFEKKGLRVSSFSSQLIFYPYWWVKGMVFSLILGKKNIPRVLSDIPSGSENIKELNTHLLDHTFPANQETPLGPPSLGVRTSAMKVRGYNQTEMEKWGLPIKTDIPYSKAVAHAEKLKGNAFKIPLSPGENLKEGYHANLPNTTIEMEKTNLIGERYSLIYFPVWVISFASTQGKSELLIDGLSHEVIKIPRDVKEGVISSLTEDAFSFAQGELRFIPFRCPLCGYDFPFHPFNVINLCSNCGRAWGEKGGTYQEVSYEVIKRQGTQNAALYLPFWSLRGSLVAPREQVTNMDEFYQRFPLPRVVNREKEKTRPIKFYIPAFRIKNIPLVNKFAALLTHYQPMGEYLEEYQKKEALLNHKIGDIYLSAPEAQQMAEIVLFSLIPANSRKVKTFVSQCRIVFSAEQLEWHPFLETPNDFREQTTGYALPKGALEIL